jgi:hypothetical protein
MCIALAVRVMFSRAAFDAATFRILHRSASDTEPLSNLGHGGPGDPEPSADSPQRSRVGIGNEFGDFSPLGVSHD